MQLPTQLLPSHSSAIAQYLKFSLKSNLTALLPVNQLAAALQIEADQITAIPHLPPWIMGVYNWRGKILWTVDLGHLVGGASLHQQSKMPAHYNVLLLEQSCTETSQQYHLGLAVHQIAGVELLSADCIQSPSDMSKPLVSFLKGYWLGADGEMLMLLESSSIFNHMPA